MIQDHENDDSKQSALSGHASPKFVQAADQECAVGSRIFQLLVNWLVMGVLSLLAINGGVILLVRALNRLLFLPSHPGLSVISVGSSRLLDSTYTNSAHEVPSLRLVRRRHL